MGKQLQKRDYIAFLGLVLFVVSFACGGGDEDVTDVGASVQALPTPTADASLGVRESIKARQLAEESGLKSTPTPAALASKEVSKLQDTRGFDRFGVRQITPTPAGLASVVEAGTMVLEGSGPSRTDLIIVSEGLLMLKATHDGTAEFIVTVLDEDNARAAAASGGAHTGAMVAGSLSPIIGSGAYDGSRLINVNPAILGKGLDPGLYFVDVVADGSWRVELSQPRWDSGDPVPVSVSGRGDAVIAPVQLIAGNLTLNATHEGPGDFVVELLKGYGTDEFVKARAESPLPPIEQAGLVDQSVGVTVYAAAMANIPGFTKGFFEDVYAIAIQADGEWTISLGP